MKKNIKIFCLIFFISYYIYDVKINAISINAALHELAHVWDFYYKHKFGATISDSKDFDDFYKSISNKLYIDGNGNVISKTETFAAMFTNYYWHILGKDTSKSYYALKNKVSLNDSEKLKLKNLIEKYINISNNGYK